MIYTKITVVKQGSILQSFYISFLFFSLTLPSFCLLSYKIPSPHPSFLLSYIFTHRILSYTYDIDIGFLGSKRIRQYSYIQQIFN